MIVREVPGEAERDRQKPGCLRRQIQPFGIRPANDHRELLEVGISQLVFFEEGVEAAPGPVMRELDQLLAVWADKVAHRAPELPGEEPK